MAMVVICATVVPMFHRAKVYTAYEYLEQRFDGKTRALASAIFLFQRGLSAGLTIYAPAIVLSVILGWPERIDHVAHGGPGGDLHGDRRNQGGDLGGRAADVLICLGLVISLVTVIHAAAGAVSFRDAVSWRARRGG